MGINYSTLKHVGYEHLVLSGGGIKGISYVGSLLELQRNNVLYDEDDKFRIKKICGVSAGSIIAALLAVGYRPHELLVVMKSINFKEIGNDGLNCMYSMVNLVECWGACPGDYIIKLMGELIEQKTGKCDYTIEDLWNDKAIQLVIVATNITYQKSTYFYAKNPIKEFAEIPIRIAVRMSMGIPIIFKPYFYGDAYFVDGGLLDNYPLHVFDGDYPGDSRARLNLCEPNPHTLGIKITTASGIESPKQDYNNLFEYSVGFINTLLMENDRRIMIPSSWNRSIILVNPDYPLNKFELTEEEQEAMIEIGKKSVEVFFSKVQNH
jgi:NTE family protein